MRPRLKGSDLGSGGILMLANIFDAFIEASPVSVMLRGVMERERLDKIFEQHAEAQYTRELLF